MKLGMEIFSYWGDFSSGFKATSQIPHPNNIIRGAKVYICTILLFLIIKVGGFGCG